jgi:sulfur-carrier protein
MKVKLRFFARFRELLGTDQVIEVPEGTTVTGVVDQACTSSAEGCAAIFAGEGKFHEHVVLMRNGRRLDTRDAGRTEAMDGDEIAVFPPVAGG